MDYCRSGSSVHGDFPGKITGVGFHFLLQGIFSIQGLNVRLLNTPILAGGFFTTTTTWEDQQSIELKLYTCMWEMGVQPAQIASGCTMGSGVDWMLGRCICQDRLGFALVTNKPWPCFSNSKGLFLTHTTCLLGSLCCVFSLQDAD